MYKVKNLFKEWYQPQQRFVVRNPLFPIEIFFRWKAEAGVNVAQSKSILVESLRNFYRQPIAQEALYIASPDLYEHLLLWLDEKIANPDKKEKIELSLVKYMTRMCTRCTPYGLFASCTIGRLSDNTDFELRDKMCLERHGRLDMEYVCSLHQQLLQEDEIRDQLLFFANTSLYRIGDSWRYLEHRIWKESGRSYHVVEIGHSDFLEKVLLAAKDGAKVVDLAKAVSDDEVSFEDAVNFIYELIDSQVLVDEMQPSLTGQEYFSILLSKVQSLGETKKYTEQLVRVAGEFKLLNKTGEVDRFTRYWEISRCLDELNIPVSPKMQIQVDSYRNGRCLLDSRVSEEILKGASVLQLLTPADVTKDPFADFKASFRDRYEGRWVPLNEVLDPEAGIGYGKFANSGLEESPLIDNLQFSNQDKSELLPEPAFFKWKMYEEALSQHKNEVAVDDSLVEKLAGQSFSPDSLPDSISIMAKIIAKDQWEIDTGNYDVILQPPFGPSGANLLSRFCHLTKDVEELVHSIMETEEELNKDAVFAEIVHLPESRVGNILARPPLREYEIPYLCGSVAAKEFQIEVNDLLVGIEENRIVLFSKRLNKEVIPRLTTAHNYNLTSAPVYKFLCDLQFQNTRTMGWHWGILDSRPFLPRVRYGRFIFSKARWRLTKDDVDSLVKSKELDLVNQFRLIRQQTLLPDYVVLSQGDNELLLQLDNILCLKLLLAEINKNEYVVLTECLETPQSCWIKSPDGIHAGEFIFTFNKIASHVTGKPGFTFHPAKTSSVPRFFPVGSEWLYAKIYSGPRTGEKILTGVIKPLTEELFAEMLIDKYFFVRYHDNGHHLRIRFHNTVNQDFWKVIIDLLKERLNPFLVKEQVYNVKFETYQREIERYGFATMELAEEIFFHQSKAVISFIAMLEGDEGEQFRWLAGMKAIDAFLDAFGLCISAKRNLIKQLDKNYGNEFHINASARKKISEQYVLHKDLLQTVLNDGLEDVGDFRRAMEFFEINKDYRRCINQISSAVCIDNDTRQFNSLISSFVHMFVNRLFINNQRKTEMVIYDYLFRYYESKVARASRANVLATR